MSLSFLSKLTRAAAPAPPPVVQRRAARPGSPATTGNNAPRPKAASAAEMNIFARALVEQAGLTDTQILEAIERARIESKTLLDVVLTLGLLSEIQCYRVLADAAKLELIDLEDQEPS